MPDFLRVLFDTADFPARWHCGNWTALHGWTHIVADLAIWGAYTAIPILLIYALVKRRDWPVPRALWLFGAFILACGTTHLIDAIIFVEPIYRLGAIAKVVTALVSWATVVVLICYGPVILRMPSVTEVNRKLEREVLERRKVEEKLREQAEVLRLALAAGQVGTWRWDIRSKQDLRDMGLNKILGVADRPTTQPVGDFFGLVHPEDREAVEQAVNLARTGDGDYSAEFRIIRRDRTIRWIRDCGRIIRDSDGTPMVMTGAAVDVTDLRMAAEGNARLAAIVENSSEAILSQSLDGVILTWNMGAERIFGYTAAEAIGQPKTLIVPEDRRVELAKYQAAARRGERFPHYQTVRRHKNGSLVDVWLAVSPIIDSQGRVTALSTVEHDVTERSRYEQRLQRLNQDLLAKNEEMEQFTYIVSHDLKSPLVTMIGFVGLLREELGDYSNVLNEQIVDNLDRIENAATRMSQLIDDLLELSRIGRVKRESVTIDVATAVADLRTVMAEELDRAGAELTIEGEPGLVYADPRRFQQVLQNLVGNAIKYGCTGEDKLIRVGTERHPDETRLYVRDRGAGIAPEHHARIFRLFEQATKGRGGTGVGLALVAKIAQAHGGRSWVDSTPGKGATFSITFPLAGISSNITSSKDAKS